ncbi:reverse transcriptase domain-containing protein [Tanacetum coccineum]
MRTRSQTRNRPQQQILPNIELLNLEEPIENQAPPVVTIADQRTMAQFLQAPTEGYENAIVVPVITADNFELKHGLLTLVQNKPFFRHDNEDSHAHIRYFNKITSTLKFPNFINQFLPPSKTTNLRNEITNFQQRFDESLSEAWDRFKDLLRASPDHGFSELHQLDTFYNDLNSNDQDSLNSAAVGNFLDKMPRDCLAIIESKSKVRYSRSKVSTSSSTLGVLPDVAELKDIVRALLLDKKNQSQAPTTLKAVEESYVTCGGAHSYRNCPTTDGNVYRDNIQNTFHKPPRLTTTKEIPVTVLRWLQIKFNLSVFLPFKTIKEIQNRYNQNRENNYNQSPIYQPPAYQAPAYQALAYQAPAPQTQGVSKDDF